jgi:hypothetical protein
MAMKFSSSMIAIVALLSALLFSFTNCMVRQEPMSGSDSNSSVPTDGGTTIGNPSSLIRSSPFVPPSNPFAFRLCVVGVEIRNSSTGEFTNLPMNPTIVVLDPNGMVLVDSKHEPSTFPYDIITLKISDGCSSGYSFKVLNAQGEFLIKSDYELPFDAVGSPNYVFDVDINFQEIANAAGLITSDTLAPGALGRGTFIFRP